jgi:hypothetical protein
MRSGAASGGRQPSQQEKVAAAKGTAEGQNKPMDGFLGGIANAHASKFDRFAVRAVFGI